MQIDIECIKKEIETYLKFNTTKELEIIPFKKIFNDKYTDSELMAVIQKNISCLKFDGKTYYIGTWNCCNGLFILMKIDNNNSNADPTE